MGNSSMQVNNKSAFNNLKINISIHSWGNSNP